MAGTLHVVGVPIGNIDDMTPRAINVLQNVDVICAEDTRKAKALFSHLNIQPSAKLISHHAHNEHESVQGILKLLQQGQNVALITDGGMPAISDPGYLLVKAAREEGVNVDVAPGVTAVTTALALSGLPCHNFYFAGFLPRKKGQAEEAIEAIKNLPAALVFYESAKRVTATLTFLAGQLGTDRQACLARELTKTHQEVLKGSLGELVETCQRKADLLGEVVLVVAPPDGEESINWQAVDDEIKQLLDGALKTKQVRDKIAQKFGLSKSLIYKRILSHNR